MTQLSSSAMLLDLLPSAEIAANTEAASASSLVDAARALVMLAMANYVSLRQFEQSMGGLASDCQNRPAATAVRELYEQWVVRAEELLARIRQLGLTNVVGADYDCLATASARTRAMLSVTLDALDRADEEVRSGQTFTLGEVRRELRAATDRHGEAGPQRVAVRSSGGGA